MRTPMFSRILHGGDYNPEQWPEAVWLEDVALMKEAHCQTMSVGIFSWAALERADGEYTFEWLDRVMNLLHANGISVVLATPSAAHPAWLSASHPEVLRCRHDRVREEHRARVNYCLTSRVYRRKSAAMAEQLARRYGSHPALILWHVSNEYHGECHCELCQSAFQAWLRERYGSLDQLNAAWGMRVWSHTVSAWTQIRSPAPWPHGQWCNLALKLDWKRFTNDQHLACYLTEAEVLRRITPEIPLTTNMHQLCTGWLHWRAFAPHVDVASWDSYPVEYFESGDWRQAAPAAFRHDFMRSLKRQPFLLMESNPGWQRGRRQKRPGMHRLASLQALAHGSESVQYFQWRNCRSQVEKYHGAVVDHDGTSAPRVFREVAELGGELEQLVAIRGAMPQPKVAVIFDEENHWALSHSPAMRGEGDSIYLDVCLEHYRCFWQRGIAVDVVASTADLSGYRLVVAPLLYMVLPGVAEQLGAYVEAGGILVISCWSGYVDQHDTAFAGGFPGPLRHMAGLWSEEIDGLVAESSQSFGMRGLGMSGSFSARRFCDVCHLDDAEVLAVYEDDYYAGRPAVTRKRSGSGWCYYLATLPDESFLTLFHGQLATQLELPRSWPGELPEGLIAQARGEYIFLLNFTSNPATVSADGRAYVEVAGNIACGEQIELPPFGAVVIHLLEGSS